MRTWFLCSSLSRLPFEADRAAFDKQGVGLIECDVLDIEGVRAVRAIGKVILQPTRAAYAGTIALPCVEAHRETLLAVKRGERAFVDILVHSASQRQFHAPS